MEFENFKQPHFVLNEENLNNSSLEKDLLLETSRLDIIEGLKIANIALPSFDIGSDVFKKVGGKNFLVAFTNTDYFYNYFYDEDVDYFVYPFKKFCEDIKDEAIEVVLNPGNDDFLVTKDIILELSGGEKITKPKFTFKELRKARREINKDKKMSRFVSKYPNVDIDKFFKIASKKHFFTYFSSIEDLSQNARENIIDLTDFQGNIFIVEEGNFRLATLFTSDKLLEPTLSFYKNRGRNIYLQMVDLKTMAEFIIQNNFDGVIVNYANGDMLIAKKHFEKYIKKLKKNKDYTNYAFII